MTKPPRQLLKHLRASDAKGIAQLATEATLGVTGIVEGVHQSVWSTLGAPGGKAKGRTRGITGLVYRSIEGVAGLLGAGAGKALGWLQPLLEAAGASKPSTPEREAVLAALNGVMGDRLEASGNPFATAMTLRHEGLALDPKKPVVPGATPRLLVLVHGLCMNDLQWRTAHEGRVVDHGQALAQALGYTPVYLRYNTGRHTSVNGAGLADLLEQVTARWPVPLQEVSLLVHSMGGLVARSAAHAAEEKGLRWRGLLRHMAFLGTPHHGAPLERAGNWVDVLLGGTPWTAPFARLGQLRSSGITDLRYGHVLEADWQGRDRFRRRPDSRAVVPLPQGVACHAVAATTAGQRSPLADRLIGDGLVPLPSALGEHDDPARCLAFARSSQWIAWRTNHMQLLSSPAVGLQLHKWLSVGH